MNLLLKSSNECIQETKFQSRKPSLHINVTAVEKLWTKKRETEGIMRSESHTTIMNTLILMLRFRVYVLWSFQPGAAAASVSAAEQ